MKKLTLSIMAAAAAMLVTQSAHAQTTSWSQGDLLLGFYDSTGTATNDYEIDLGPISSFINASGTVSLGNVGADLGTVFNSSSPTTTWTTDANLKWGAAAYSGIAGSDGVAAKTVFLTKNSTLSAPVDQSSAANGNMGTAINAASNGTGGFSGQTTTATSPDAYIQATSATNAWIKKQGTSPTFNSFSSGFDISASSVGGIFNTTLSLYEMAPTNGAASIDLGTFGISSNGDLTFTTPVPEPPATASLVILACLGVWMMNRLVSSGIRI